LLGDPEDVRRKFQDYAVGAIDAGLAALAALIGPAGSAGIIGAGHASGITESVAGQIAEWVRDMLGDDLIGQRDFVISNEYLLRLRDGAVPNKTSASLKSQTDVYNFPEGPEDDSWMIKRGSGAGTGSYRPFFRIRTQKKDV